MKVHSYTPIADLLVDLTDTKKQQHLFLVSSANLRVASPVWRKILDPDSRFAPLKTGSVNAKEYKQINIEGVDVKSLHIILSILHYCTENIPKEWMSSPNFSTLQPPILCFSILRDVALLVDQYDCVGITSHFASKWIGSGVGRRSWPSDPDYVEVGFEDWIFIASVFNRLGSAARVCNGIVKFVSKELIKEVCVNRRESRDLQEAKYYRWKEKRPGPRDDPNPTLVEKDTSPGNTEPIETRNCEGKLFELMEVSLEMVPEKILGFILDTRFSSGCRMLVPLYKFVQDFLNSEPTCQDTWLCKNKECSAIALGTLVQSLKEQGLQHILTQNLIEDQLLPLGRYSLQDLALKIKGLQMTTFQIHNAHMKMASDDFDNSVKSAVVVKTTIKPTGIQRSTLAYRDGPIFLRNDPDIYSAQSTAICPLALRLAKIKTDAKSLLDSVEGYQES